MKSPTKANIVRPASMDSEALSKYIADQTAGVLRRLKDLRPFYEELWKNPGAKIIEIIDARGNVLRGEGIL